MNGEMDEQYTIVWGLESLVPRALYPEKRDMNIGNFFFRNNLARATHETLTSTISNVGLSIPFEFVDNFGWLAGTLCFGLLGIAWAVITGCLLTAGRFHNHPLTPAMVALAGGTEAALGHWLASLRDLVFPLLILYIIYRLSDRKL
jgi:hypothetical protein